MADSYSITIEILPRTLDIQEMTVELDGSTTVSELQQFALDTYPQIPNKNYSSYTLLSQAKRANFASHQTISQILGVTRSDRFTINTSPNAPQPGGQLLQTNPYGRNNSVQIIQIQNPQVQPNQSQYQQPYQPQESYYQNPNSQQIIIYYQYYNIAGQVAVQANSTLGDLYLAIQNNMNKSPIDLFLYQQNLRIHQQSSLISQLGIQNGCQLIVQDGQQVPKSDVIQNKANEANFQKEIQLQFQVLDGSRQSQYKGKFKTQQKLHEIASSVQSYLGIGTDSAAVDIYLFGQIYNKKMEQTLEQLQLKDGQIVEARVRWIGGLI